MKSYSFVYRGLVSDGEDLASVQRRLASLFNTDIDAFNPIFSNKYFFERTGLDQYTAELYQSMFLNVGAVGEILVDENELDPNLVSEPSPDLNKRLAVKEKTAKWLISNVFLILGIIIVDDYLIDVSIITLPNGYDIGYWPIMCAHILLVLTSGVYAWARKYSIFWGLLGFLSVFGVSILLYVTRSTSGEEDHSISFKHRIGLAASACVLVYWISGHVDRLRVLDHTPSQSKLLFQGREEYPSQVLQTVSVIYTKEFNELKTYIEDTVSVLKNGSLRPKQEAEIGHLMFSEMARYEVWLNYQHWLHQSKRRKIPDSLTSAKRKQQRQALIQLVSSLNTGRLGMVKNEWFVGPMPHHASPVPPQYIGLGRYISSIFDVYRYSHLRSMSKRPSLLNHQADEDREPSDQDTINLKALSFPKNEKVGVTVKNNEIRLTFTSGPDLVMGLYIRSSENSRGRRVSMPTLVMLSPTFPYQFVYGYHRIFEPYSRLEIGR